MSEFTKTKISLNGYEILNALQAVNNAIDSCTGGPFGYVLSKNTTVLSQAKQDIQEQRRDIRLDHAEIGEDGTPKTETVETPEGPVERIKVEDEKEFREARDEFLNKKTEVSIYQTRPSNFPTGINQEHMILLDFMFTDPQNAQ